MAGDVPTAGVPAIRSAPSFSTAGPSTSSLEYVSCSYLEQFFHTSSLRLTENIAADLTQQAATGTYRKIASSPDLLYYQERVSSSSISSSHFPTKVLPATSLYLLLKAKLCWMLIFFDLLYGW